MQKPMEIPHGAKFIIERLENAGKRADVVGGSVRDFLRGKTANDFDITTSASPEEMKEIFQDVRTAETGIKHGTLTIIIDKTPYEVTTYRKDGNYTDNRRPDSVTFTSELSDDLSRRDFTMNAIAYSDKHGYTDCFGGMNDIRNKIVRAVGNPETRFNEDALRILRALRFASVLGFRLEEKTSEAVLKTAKLLLNVSAERIFEEWKKLVGGVLARKVIEEYRTVIEEFLPELSNALCCIAVGFDLLSAEERELLLFAGVENPDGKYLLAMKRLKSDTKRIKQGIAVLKSIKAPTETERDIRLLLLKTDFSTAKAVINIKHALGTAEHAAKDLISHLEKNNTPHKISDLAIDGEDIKELGLSGKAVGDCLEMLIYKVATEEIENESTALIGFVKQNFVI